MLIRKVCLVCLILITLAACSSPTAQSVIADASAAMGAAQLKSIEYSGTGFQFALGQSPNPNAPWPKFNAKSFTRAINYEMPALRQVLVRTQAENPPHGGGNQPIVGERTETLVAGASSPWDTQMEIWITPHGFLKGAAANQATLAQAVPAERTKAFLTEFAEYETKGAMPRLILLRHSGDDAELGRIIETISKSRFWARTAVFIAGANAPALVISPLSRGMQIPTSELYNQSSVLRTVEMILKLRPMTLFDAAARPLIAAFAAPSGSSTPYIPAP